MINKNTTFEMKGSVMDDKKKYKIIKRIKIITMLVIICILAFVGYRVTQGNVQFTPDNVSDICIKAGLSQDSTYSADSKADISMELVNQESTIKVVYNHYSDNTYAINKYQDTYNDYRLQYEQTAKTHEEKNLSDRRYYEATGNKVYHLIYFYYNTIIEVNCTAKADIPVAKKLGHKIISLQY